MAFYLTKQEAIVKEITQRLGENHDKYNIQSLAQELIISDGTRIDKRYFLDTTKNFWEVAQKQLSENQ